VAATLATSVKWGGTTGLRLDSPGSEGLRISLDNRRKHPNNLGQVQDTSNNAYPDT